MENQRISNALMFISDKRVQLNAPGTMLTGNYYSRENSQVARAETTWNTGRYTQSLSNLNFGAQSTIVIPNSSLLRNCYLHLRLPAVVADQTLCRGWGYAAIESISYLFGSANVSQLQINGQSNFQAVMLEANTSEKKSELLRLGGQEYLEPTAGEVEATVCLSLPWSNQGCCKLPIDTTLLDSPITISIKLADASRLYGGVGARPASFLDSLVILAQGEFLNKDLSLKNELIVNPDLRYNYPFIHKQTNIVSVDSSAGVPIIINLLSFINADLLAITFGLVKRNFVNDPTGAQPPNPFAYGEMSNIELTYNGLDMYKAVGKSYKVFNMQDEDGASFIKNSRIDAGTVQPFVSNPVDSYITAVNFSQNPAYTFNRKFYNVWRIGNNTLNLQFTPDEEGPYFLYTTYYFNGMASINGDCQIYFD